MYFLKFNKNNPSRIDWIDNIRAMSILWIICVAHMDEYTAVSLSLPLFSWINKGFMSSLSFIAGYCIKNYNFITIKDAVSFVKKRLLRLYPLYFIAGLLMFIVSSAFGLNYVRDGKQLMYTLTGLSMFFMPKSASTLWYVSMLLVFIIITPIIASDYEKRRFLKRVAGILAILVALDVLPILFVPIVDITWFFNVDDRLIYYFPFYVGGLLLGKEKFDFARIKWRLCISAAVIAILLCAMLVWLDSLTYPISTIVEYPLIWGYCLSFVVFLIPVVRFYPTILNKCLSLIAYASMCMYLFHRQFYAVAMDYMGNIPVWVAYCLLLPVLFCISYGVQSLYDLVVKKARRANTEDQILSGTL